MDCDVLKAKYDELEATIRQLEHEGEPPGELSRLTAEAWEIGIEYAECKAGNPGIQTIVNLNGKWASGGVPGPVISVTGESLSIDMSALGRPAAKGAILDDSDIWVTFPDDNSYTGKLQPPNEIIWSNNSAWTKV